MSSDYDHDHCQQVKVTRLRYTGWRDTEVVFQGQGEIRGLDRQYEWLGQRFMLETCDGFYSDGSARHIQVEMEGAEVHLYGSSSWIGGFVRGSGSRDDFDNPNFHKESWHFDAFGGEIVGGEVGEVAEQ